MTPETKAWLKLFGQRVNAMVTDLEAVIDELEDEENVANVLVQEDLGILHDILGTLEEVDADIDRHYIGGVHS